MTFEHIITIKIIFSLLSSIFILGVERCKMSTFFTHKYSLHLTFLFTRIIPFILIYLVLDLETRGDLPFFYAKAQQAVQLKLVYRDFLSYHSPFFAYLLALPLVCWNHPASILLFMIFGEYFTLLITKKFLKKTHNLPQINYYSHIYLLLPAPFVILLFSGQEDIWLWGIFVAALYQFRRHNNLYLTGVILSLMLIAVKITSIFIFIPLFFALQWKDKYKLLLSVGATTCLVFGTLYVFVGDLLWQFINHTKDPYSPNVLSVSYPYLNSLLKNYTLTQFNWFFLSILVVLLISLGNYCKHLPILKTGPYIWIITFGLFTILLPASMIYYTFIYLISIYFFLIAGRNQIKMVLFLFFNLLIIVQPYLFVRLGNTYQINFDFLREPMKVLEYLTEILLIGWVLYYAKLSFNEIKKIKQSLN